jgi:hypothetical protein
MTQPKDPQEKRAAQAVIKSAKPERPGSYGCLYLHIGPSLLFNSFVEIIDFATIAFGMENFH